MVILTRKQLLAAKPQTNQNLPSDLGLAENAGVIVLDMAITPEVESIERNLSKDTLTSVKSAVGKKTVGFGFGVELKGTRLGTHAAGAPDWSRFLESAGFRMVEVSAITIGAISATGSASSTTFRHGETVTQATSGATARVFMDAHNGVAELYVEKDSITGSPDGTNIWTGADSGAAATAGAVPADEGYGWHPITDPTKSVTFDGTGLTTALSVGDIIRGVTSRATATVVEAATPGADTVIKFRERRGIFAGGEVVERLQPSPDTDIGTLASPTAEQYLNWAPLAMRRYKDGRAVTGIGCRGSVAFSFEVNRPGRMDFTYRGVLNDVDDATFLSGIQFDNTLPPIWESSSIGFSKNDALADMDVADEIAPCISALSVDMGVTLADRACAGAANGLKEIRGGGRAATGSMTVEDALESDAGWLTRVESGDIARLRWTLGSTDGARFTFAMPGMQATGASEGDAEGIATQTLSFAATGGDLFDLDTGATGVSSIGGDNELILLYHTA